MTMHYVITAIFLAALSLHSFAEEQDNTGNPEAAEANATEETAAAAPAGSGDGYEEPLIDFENEDTFIDISDALRSKQYVHRAILSTVIDHTSKFSFGRYYLNHAMGFSAVWQRADAPFVKYSSGIQSLAGGYVSEGGHGWELGLELSSVSAIFAGYRYFIRPESFSIWPAIGFGVGHELEQLKISNGPPETDLYAGPRYMGYVIVSLLVPLVDVGLKAELRANFYLLSRVVFTQSVGAVIFL